jgi:hypothetical protein
MRSLTTFFDQRTAPSSLLMRCFHVVQIVASIWTLVGAGLQMLGLNLAESSPMHAKVQMASIGCLMVAVGIYSVLLPLYFVLRDAGGQSS